MSDDHALKAVTRQLVELSLNNPPVHSFNRQLVRLVVDAVGARAATLWLIQNNELILCEEIEQVVGAVRNLGMPENQQEQALRAAFEQGKMTILGGGPQPFDPNQSQGTQSVSAAFIPVVGMRGNVGVLRVIFPPQPPWVLTRLVQLTETLAGYYSLYSAQRVLNVQMQERQDIDRLSKAILQLQHYSFSGQLPEVIVNSAVEVAPLDRVILLTADKGGDLKLRATSSVSVQTKKGAWARLVTEMAEIVLLKGEPLQYDPGRNQPEDITDVELREKVSSYVLMTEVKSLLAYPLNAGKENAGVLIMECMGDRMLSQFERVVCTVYAAHAGSALMNNRVFKSLPFSNFYGKRLDREIEKLERRPFRYELFLKWGGGILLVLGVVWLLFLWKVPEKVGAECFVEPQESRTVTAKVAGKIEEVRFRLGDRVEQGALLIQLRTDELELEKKKETENARNIEAAIAKLRGEVETAKESERRGSNLAEMRVQEHSLNAKLVQLQILDSAIADCSLRAPIAGTVIEPEEPEKLRGVTVQEGEVLCAVGSINERVKLKVAVPAERINDVRVGQEVEIQLRPLMGQDVLPGKIEEIAQRSCTYKSTNVFMAQVTMENRMEQRPGGQSAQLLLKPGMTGKAKLILPGEFCYATIYSRLLWRKFQYWMY